MSTLNFNDKTGSTDPCYFTFFRFVFFERIRLEALFHGVIEFQFLPRAISWRRRRRFLRDVPEHIRQGNDLKKWHIDALNAPFG